MDFSIPSKLTKDADRFKMFLGEKLLPNLSTWYHEGAIPRSFYADVGKGGWFGFTWKGGRLDRQTYMREALFSEQLAIMSPGVAVAVLAHADLGLMGLWFFGSEDLKQKYGPKAVRGETLLCVGNTESGAGSDVANIQMEARKIKGGWRLSGTKAYVTNGHMGDMAVVTAISDPEADRNSRLSMFLVDLSPEGIRRTKLNKQGWIPSDLTRLQLTDVFVPEDHLLGERGRGLQQVLNIFTHSRVPIGALTIGTAVGAFEMAIEHGKKRHIFGKRIIDFQAKAFEIADFYARIEAARLMLWKACWAMDRGEAFRLESSMAKYLSVQMAREVAVWAADIFGAASIMFEHPIHKFPMDVWGASLGEGTQDVQKLVIFREVMNRFGIRALGT